MSKKIETPTVTKKQILAKLKKHGELRHEQLAKELGVTTALTGPLLRGMLSSGEVTSKGVTRATLYSAAA